MEEFLDEVFVMTPVSNVDLQKRFPVVQIDSMFQRASVCHSSAQNEDLESLSVDWERVKIVHANSTLLLGILQGHSKNHPFLNIWNL